MRKSRYSDAQFLAILKRNVQGVSVPDLCRERGMSSAQFYKWRAKYGGMDASMMKRLKELELNLRIRPKRRIKRDKPDVLSVSIAINQVWSIDFMSDALADGRLLRTFNVLDDYNRFLLSCRAQRRSQNPYPDFSGTHQRRP